MRRSLLVAVALVPVLSACGSNSTTTVTRTPAANTTTISPKSVSSSTTVTPPPAAPAYFQGVVGPPAQKPGALQLTGDGTLSVEQVQWSSWGGPEATGTGNAVYHGCTPNCAAARVHAALVSVRLSDVRQCKGRRYYAGVALTLSSGRLLDRQFVERNWSPC